MPAITQATVRLTGELVAFRSLTEDGWGKGTLVEAGGLPTDIVGKLIGVRVGDTVELEGVWAEHPKYGRQLKVRACTSVMPESDDGVVAWLVSMLPDVGVNRAKALVARFGGAAGLWDTIEHRHADLARVDGITPPRAAAIHQAYMRNRGSRDNMVTLRGWGLTDNQIAKCGTAWGSLDSIVQHIQRNPYELSDCVYGFGFTRSDAVALKAGLPFDSPYRITAGVAHVLAESVGEGDCYVPFGKLRAMAEKLLGVHEDAVADSIRTAIRRGALACREHHVYTRGIEAAERSNIEALDQLTRREAA